MNAEAVLFLIQRLEDEHTAVRAQATMHPLVDLVRVTYRPRRCPAASHAVTSPLVGSLPVWVPFA